MNNLELAVLALLAWPIALVLAGLFIWIVETPR